MNDYSIVKHYLRRAVGRSLSGAQAGAAGTGRADAGVGDERVPGSLPRLLNSVALILGRVSTLALGFLSWLLAARLFAPAQVGLASGAVSAMMLCVQLALLGVGSAVIALFPQHQHRPSDLLNTAMSIVTGTAIIAAGLFLVLASGAFHELSVVGSIPLYTLLFLALSVFGTVGVLFDHISIALRRSDQVLVRNVLFGVVTIAFLGILPLVAGAASSLAIFAAWVMGGLSAYLLGFIQLRRSLSQYRLRPHVEPRLAGQLLRIGFANYALTLAERAPGSILPIVVIELLSPVANAYWYPVWMMGWGALVIPISVGQTLFAEAAHRPESLGDEIRHSIRSSLALGFVAAAGAALLAPLLLSFLGPNYADAGTTPLRILVVGALPFTFIQAYFATCRATQRLREAILTGMLSGLAGIAGAAVAGITYGLPGMALAWLVVQFLTGAWAIWRLRSLSRRERIRSLSD